MERKYPEPGRFPGEEVGKRDATQSHIAHIRIENPTEHLVKELTDALCQQGYHVEVLLPLQSEAAAPGASSYRFVCLQVELPADVQKPEEEPQSKPQQHPVRPEYPEIMSGPDSRTDSLASIQIPSLAEAEAAHIVQVLAMFDGNRTQASNALGIARSTLIRKLQFFEKMKVKLPDSLK